MKETITSTQNDSFIYQIPVKEKGEVLYINTAEILWFEADTNYVKMHTATRIFIKKTSLKELELQLDPNLFVRIHRSTIISFDSIQTMFPYFKEEFIIVLNNGKALRLSRSYQDKVSLIRERQKKSA